ncbi:MAG: hypothetical protein R3C05_31780 [Pirellulaceae bacterium]
MVVASVDLLDADDRKRMRDFAASLNEKDRRRFAAFEAKQRGHGGIAYVAEVIGCSRRTIERGMGELDNLENDPAKGRVRRPGGGRKKRLLTIPRSSRI